MATITLASARIAESGCAEEQSATGSLSGKVLEEIAMAQPEAEAGHSLVRRLSWMAAIWTASVGTLGAVALLLRSILH